jgi:hypothetical protein
MPLEQRRNPSEQSHSNQPSNPGVNLGEKEITPNQLPQDEGKPNYNSSSLEELGLSELLTQFEALKRDAGLTITDLKEKIRIAVKYIQQLKRNDNEDNESRQLAASLVKDIANNLEAVVSKIENSQFPYETNTDFLKRLISFMVGLISETDLEFRGRKPGEYADEEDADEEDADEEDADEEDADEEDADEEDADQPNNALLTALDSATFALLNEAATEASRLNNFEKLTDA